MKISDWIKSLEKKVSNFLKVISEDDFNYIKYSLSGDLYDCKVNWGLGQNVFMIKILYILDILNNISLEQKTNLIRNIKKFEDRDGYIADPLIRKLITGNKFIFFKERTNVNKVEKIRRAETRQSFSALNCLNERPKKPFLHIPCTENEIDNFLSDLDWEFPWDAGSHFSHLLFFLKLNEKMFGYKKKETDNLIKYANEWVDNIQSKSDGFWYIKDATAKEKINGAMKILTGKEAANILTINNHEKIIDGCLNAVNDSEEACSNFNIIYCLYYCSRISDYKKKEIKKFCYDRLDIYRKFYFEDIGGFSFHLNKANDIYYGAKITRGLNEPDIHGTVMFLWGITLISKILELDFIDFKIPLT